MNIIFMEPVYKDYIWGGKKLKNKFNKNTPFETLTALTQDECPYVREAATQALSERKVKNKCDMVK